MSNKLSSLDYYGGPQECPLCLEMLDGDDLNIYPCTCRYQICLFCWHRIKTEQNGLCPACRKPYKELPAVVKTQSSVKHPNPKSEKKTEKSRTIAKDYKNLQNLRIVQKNLVSVVGLPMHLADAEILKRVEYFGKFGIIEKLLVNTDTKNAGAKNIGCRAYITYKKPEDALKAVQSLNMTNVEGRQVRVSLGTSKYCSFFLRSLQKEKGASLPDSECNFYGHKSYKEMKDCFYLHEIGDEGTAFTPEEMRLGKHKEYKKKLHD